MFRPTKCPLSLRSHVTPQGLPEREGVLPPGVRESDRTLPVLGLSARDGDARVLGLWMALAHPGLWAPGTLWCWEQGRGGWKLAGADLLPGKSPRRLGSVVAWHRTPELPSRSTGLLPAVTDTTHSPGLPQPTLALLPQALGVRAHVLQARGSSAAAKDRTWRPPGRRGWLLEPRSQHRLCLPGPGVMGTCAQPPAV